MDYIRLGDVYVGNQNTPPTPMPSPSGGAAGRGRGLRAVLGLSLLSASRKTSKKRRKSRRKGQKR